MKLLHPPTDSDDGSNDRCQVFPSSWLTDSILLWESWAVAVQWTEYPFTVMYTVHCTALTVQLSPPHPILEIIRSVASSSDTFREISSLVYLLSLELWIHIILKSYKEHSTRVILKGTLYTWYLTRYTVHVLSYKENWTRVILQVLPWMELWIHVEIISEGALAVPQYWRYLDTC